MSFFIRNLHTEKDLLRAMSSQRRILVVRFGSAERDACKHMDAILSRVELLVAHFFAVYACEIRDMSADIVQKYGLADKRLSIVFFSDSVPVRIAFNREASIHVTEVIPCKDALLDLFIMVKQGISRGLPVVRVPAVYARPVCPMHRAPGTGQVAIE